MWLAGLVAPRHVGSSRTRDRTRVPCIGRRILIHCATREAPVIQFLTYDYYFMLVNFFATFSATPPPHPHLHQHPRLMLPSLGTTSCEASSLGDILAFTGGGAELLWDEPQSGLTHPSIRTHQAQSLRTVLAEPEKDLLALHLQDFHFLREWREK